MKAHLADLAVAAPADSDATLPVMPILLCCIATLCLLFAEWRSWRLGIWMCKPIASLGFVLAAWSASSSADAYATAVRCALIACAIGDVLLIAELEAAFLAGVAAFAFGHLMYAWAFWTRGLHAGVAGAALVGLGWFAAYVWRWLSPHLPAKLTPAVRVYFVIITVMVACAIGTSGKHAAPSYALGAVLFFVSDLSVARDKFVKPELINRLWGLPLYYAAQLVLACTVNR